MTASSSKYFRLDFRLLSRLYGHCMELFLVPKTWRAARNTLNRQQCWYRSSSWVSKDQPLEEAGVPVSDSSMAMGEDDGS